MERCHLSRSLRYASVTTRFIFVRRELPIATNLPFAGDGGSILCDHGVPELQRRLAQGILVAPYPPSIAWLVAE
jgi:hypothetical protein